MERSCRCGKKIPVKLKAKIYTTVIRPVLVYGAEYWTLRKKEEDLKRTEMMMVRWLTGVSLKEKKKKKKKNEEVLKLANITPIAKKLMEVRFRWYSHVLRSEEDPIRKAFEM